VFGGSFTRPQHCLSLFNEYAALIIRSYGLSIAMASGGMAISAGGIPTFVCMSCMVCSDDKCFGMLDSLLLALIGRTVLIQES
jgi:ribose/xylose/arabinose/galactoside ABC-type transport system permease subunit